MCSLMVQMYGWFEIPYKTNASELTKAIILKSTGEPIIKGTLWRAWRMGVDDGKLFWKLKKVINEGCKAFEEQRIEFNL